MFCKNGHKDIAKHSINEDQSTEETGKIGTFIYITDCFYTNPSGFYFGTGRKMDSFYVKIFYDFYRKICKIFSYFN